MRYLVIAVLWISCFALFSMAYLVSDIVAGGRDSIVEEHPEDLTYLLREAYCTGFLVAGHEIYKYAQESKTISDSDSKLIAEAWEKQYLKFFKKEGCVEKASWQK